jgi:hypothetical protein
MPLLTARPDHRRAAQTAVVAAGHHRPARCVSSYRSVATSSPPISYVHTPGGGVR